jgi:hypothetical protein
MPDRVAKAVINAVTAVGTKFIMSLQVYFANMGQFLFINPLGIF